MRVMGIDCGGQYTGFGVIESVTGRDLICIAAGAVKLSAKDSLEIRLNKIFESLTQVISDCQPEVVAIEDVFYAENAKSALKLGHVRGVAMLAVARAGLVVKPYAPLSVKQAVVGYGLADKAQVQTMVKRLLKLEEMPKPPDVADALAIAICHLHTAATLRRQAAAR